MQNGVEIYSYTGYPFLMDGSAMGWAIVGYGVLLLFAIMQAWVICSVLISGLINRYRKTDIRWLRYLGATTNFSGSANAAQEKKRIGSWQIALAVCLALPFLTQSPQGALVLLSGAAAAGTIAVLFFAERRIANAGTFTRLLTGLMRGVTLCFAIATLGFIAYEQKDGLTFGLGQALSAFDYREKEISWQIESDKSSPKEGQMAPDFRLTDVAGQESRLADFLGDKPVLLFFGANSCPPFSAGTKGINALHEKYGDRVKFVGVYVNEPHPVDGWWLAASKIQQMIYRAANPRARIDIVQPKTQEARNQIARRAHDNMLDHDIPLLVDSIDNRVNNLYTGQPARIYLLDKTGRVIYNQGTGPYSFNPAYAEPVIEKYLRSVDGV